MARMAREKPKDIGSFPDRDDILLGVLTAVDRNANVSQRHISRELGVALGLANAYLRRCVKKGLIKIQQVPRRRYVYYLTPHGFAEKARLTGQYLSSSFNFFRSAREQMSELLAECAGKGWRRIVLAGASELAEVATLCVHDQDVELVAVLDYTHDGGRFSGLPIHRTLAECGPVDVVIVTNLMTPDKVFYDLGTQMSAERVLAPRLLRIASIPVSDREFSPEAAE